jgi:hypothetical protein
MRKLFTLLIFTLFWAGSSWGQNVFFEGFETGNTDQTVISDWTQVSVAGTASWLANNTLTTYNRTPRTGSWNAFLQYGNTDWMFKSVSLTAGTIYELTFYARQDVTTGCNILASYGTEASVAGMTNSIIPSTAVSNGNYQLFSGAFSPAVTGTFFIGIRADLTFSPYYVSIDDISLNEVLPAAPNCANIVSPADAATNVLPTATLNWSSGGGLPTGYNLYFGAGSLPGTFTDLGNVTTYDPSPDMAYSTTYYWKVVPYNANGDATGCATWSFTTMADPTITTFPYSQGFEDATFPPPGWTEARTPASSYGWATFATGYTGKCVRFDSYLNASANISTLVTPPINLSSLATARLKFMFKNPTGGDFSVLLSTDGGVTYPNTIWSGLTGQTDWVEKIADITAYIGSDVKIAFKGISNYGSGDAYIYLDDVTIEEIPNAPVFAITPASKDFGTVGVGESLSQVFTISNTGVGTLVINPAISISGTNADQFILTDGNTYPLNLTTGQTATVSVAFMPTSEGVKNANLIIVDNLGAKTSNSVPLTGTGFERPAGSTCGNPYPVTLPLVDFAGDTDGMGDDYSSTWVTPTNSYLGGDDMVFEFTLAAPSFLSGSISTTLTYPGLIITQDCPDLLAPAAVLASATASGSFASFSDVLLPAGTYFAIVSSWPTPQTIDFTLNLSAVEAEFGTLRGEVSDCYSTALLEGVSVTAGSLSTTTDIDGYYTFQNVPVGTYDIVTSLSGYVNKTTSGVGVLNGQTTNQNICMNQYLAPPVNLQASVTNQDVHLTWNAPGDLPDTEELIYDNDIITGAYSYEGATMAIHMSPQGPCKILTLKYYTTIQSGDNTFNAEVYNWDEIASTPGTTLLYEVGATAIDGNWMEIDISSQNITVSGDFVVGFGSLNATTFLGFDANLDNGRIWDYDGAEWTEWIEAYLIRAVVEYGDGSRQLLTATPSFNSKHAPITNLMSKHEILNGKIAANMQLTPSNVTGIQFDKSNKHSLVAPINNKANRFTNSTNQFIEITDNGRSPLSSLTGYNVYRDGTEIIHNIAPLLYNDLNLPAGIYSYTVTAQYLEGESEPAGPVLAEVITCPAPIDLTVNVTTNSAVLSWTPQGSATTWDVEWGETGFIPGTGTMLNVSNPTTTITSLTSGGQYDFYVRSYCSSTDQSYWVGPKTFRTHFFECPVGSTAELENCGDDTNGGCNMDVPAFGSISLGETICGTSWQNGGFRDTDWFEFTLTATTVVTLTGTGDFDIVVGFIASPCPATAFIDYGSALAGATASVTTQLDAGTYYAFVGAAAGTFYCGEGDRYQVTLTGTTCLDIPTALGAANITQTSADLSWTSAGSKWNIEYGISGFTHGNGTTVSGLTSPAYSPYDLVASESYTFYVQTDCGSEVGAWSAPYTFSTACDPIGLPWVENFDGVTIPTLPSCWLKENGDWATTNNASSTYDADARSGTQFLRESYGATNEYVWTPGFTLTAGQAYDFSFWWAGDGYDEWDGDVFVNGSQSSIGATQLGAPFVDFATETTKTYEQVTRTFTPATSGIYYFAIRVNATFGPWYLSFDDFSLMESAATKTLNLSGVRLESLFVEGTGGMMNQAYNEIGPEYAAPTADVITVELHDASNYATILRTYPGVLLSQTGTASVSGIDIPDGSYSITIKHRNSIEVTSALPVDFSGGLISYAFDTDVSCFGSNLKLIDGFYCIYAGDVNQDGQVENADASDIGNGVDTFAKGYLTIDVDGDGQLGNSDYTMYENNANNFVKKIIPIP